MDNTYAGHVVGYLLAQSWQIAILAVSVGLICAFLKSRSAHLRYLLWLIVLAKCLVPPFLCVPVAVLPESDSTPFATMTPPPGEDSAARDAMVTLPQESLPAEIRTSVVGDAESLESKPAMLRTAEPIVLVWAGGALAFLLWVCGRAVRYTSWLRGRRRPLCPVLEKSIKELSAGFGFRTPPRIWLLDDIGQPFVWGLLRGSVYLPASFADLPGSDQQRSVLAHELSHVARFDAGVNSLQVVAQTLYWFHPVIWWANRKIRQEREKCCDEMAVAQLSTPPEQYTGAIVDTLAAERRSAHPIPSLAVVGSVKDIEERIKTMLTPGRTFRTRPTVVAVTVASLIALVTIPTALVLTARGQSRPASSVASAEEGKSRYAARPFNSKLAFRVYVRETPTSSWRRVADTPSEAPLQIPACWCWAVEPSTRVEDWDALAREMSLSGIPGLRLGSCTDSDLKYLADLGALRWLALARTSITDGGLEHLKGLTRLETLDLSATQITNDGLAHVRSLTGLRDLFLGKTQITDAGLQQLQGMANLETLSLNLDRITDEGLGYLEGLPRLRELGLGGTRVTDAGLERLNRLTALRSLQLGGTQVIGQGLVHLGALTGLEFLDLRNCPITDTNLAHVRSVTKLRGLVLSGTQITDAGLMHLENLTALESLHLAQTRITDAGLEHIRGLTSLETLGLDETRITDAGLERLQALTGLQRLWLDKTQISDAGLEHLKGLTKLLDLSMQGTQITDAGLRHLQGLTGLQRLWLDNTQIGDAGLGHLKGMTELTMLELPGTRVTDAGLEHLKGLTKLSGLYLVRTAVTDAGLKHLQGLTSLRELGLIETRVTEAGARQLKQSLPNLTVYTDLPQPVAQATDKPAEPIRARGTPVFVDNFDSGPALQWRFTDLRNAKGLSAPGHAVANGQLRLSHAKALLDINDLTDYVVTARFCIKESVPGGHGGFGIETRVVPSLSGARNSDYYDLVLSYDIPPSLRLALLYYDASGTQHPAILDVVSCKVALDQWYTLAFEVQGQQLRGYLDGKLLVEGTDERLTKGRVRLSGVNAVVLVDDLSVRSLPAVPATTAQTPLLARPVAQRDVDSNRSEPPRYPARTFNSSFPFEVLQATGPYQWELLGRTPSAAPLEIPACLLWGVRPSGPVQDWDLLVREMNRNKVPYLELASPTDSDLAHVAKLTELEALYLAGQEITDAGLKHLQGLTKLRWLSMRSKQITEAGLTSLKGLNALQTLQLAAGVTDAGAAHLQGLTGLQTLYLTDCPITDAGLASLARLTGLQDLLVWNTQVTDAGLERLLGLTRLKSLYLQGDRFTGSGLTPLKGLASLRSLNLGGSRITDSDLQYLASFTDLQDLKLQGTQITDAGLAHFKGLAALQVLWLDRTRITDAGLGHVVGLTGLRELHLSGTQTTDAGLASLRGLSRLHLLDLDGTRVTDAGIGQLEGLTGLRYLYLSGTQVTEAGVQRLRQSLPKLTVTRNPSPQAAPNAGGADGV